MFSSRETTTIFVQIRKDIKSHRHERLRKLLKELSHDRENVKLIKEYLSDKYRSRFE